jgi:uncharacterized membrane protein YozB (DUF420 family)
VEGLEDLRGVYFVALCIHVIILIVEVALSNWQVRKTGQARLGVELKHLSKHTQVARMVADIMPRRT